MMWCEHCRDHFDVDHYGEDDSHKTGAEFGLVGKQMAERDELRAAAYEALSFIVDLELPDDDGSTYRLARRLRKALDA